MFHEIPLDPIKYPWNLHLQLISPWFSHEISILWPPSSLFDNVATCQAVVALKALAEGAFGRRDEGRMAMVISKLVIVITMAVICA